MYNDESSHSSQDHGAGFVRRPIPKYNGDKSGGEYQQQDQQTPTPTQRSYSSGGGYRSGGYNRDRQNDGAQSSYSGSARRDGRRAEGGSSGGYGGSSGGYRSGGSGGGYGYNRGGGYGSNDRVTKQNDIIIQLLKDIRDRLPAPPEGTSPSNSSKTYGSTESESYSSGSSYRSSSRPYTSYKTPRSSSVSDGDGDEGEFDVSSGSGNAGASAPSAGDGDGEFNN
ncbi:hypothetical protein R80B4_02569 [Fibrobacteres bacterium R8-0-B4]